MTRRMAKEWLDLMAASDGKTICGAFGLPYPIRPDSDAFARSIALLDLGLCEAKIVAEPRLRRNPAKAERDADLGRDTIHLAPTWRYAIEDDRPVVALILPVGDDDRWTRPMSLQHYNRDELFAQDIVDLIAIPLDNSRPLSMSGHTLAVGKFSVADEKMVVQASGIHWLSNYVRQVGEITADTPPHLVPKLHFPLPPPDDVATLLIEPLGLEWRVTHAACVIPFAAREVVVPDSRKLAQAIYGLMRRKERTRPLPVVRGPREVSSTA